MPNRIIREGILSSERVCSLDWASEVFYRRLMSVVDDYGRFEAGPQLLRAKCYPLQVDRVREADISRWMAACQTAGLIVLYQGVSGGRSKQFLEVVDFKQQTRTESKYPNPPEEKPMISNATQMIANDIKCQQMKSFAHLGVSVSVSEDVSVSGQVETIYSSYPRRVQKAAALKAIKKALQHKKFDELLEATKAFAESCARWSHDRKQYIPYPASWFNGGCYDDDRAEWKKNEESENLLGETWSGEKRTTVEEALKAIRGE